MKFQIPVIEFCSGWWPVVCPSPAGTQNLRIRCLMKDPVYAKWLLCYPSCAVVFSYVFVDVENVKHIGTALPVGRRLSTADVTCDHQISEALTESVYSYLRCRTLYTGLTMPKRARNWQRSSGARTPDFLKLFRRQFMMTPLWLFGCHQGRHLLES